MLCKHNEKIWFYLAVSFQFVSFSNKRSHLDVHYAVSAFIFTSKFYFLFRIGKLMLLGAIFRCLDPALTIGAILSYRSPFVSVSTVFYSSTESLTRWLGVGRSGDTARQSLELGSKFLLSPLYKKIWIWRGLISFIPLQSQNFFLLVKTQ